MSCYYNTSSITIFAVQFNSVQGVVLYSLSLALDRVFRMSVLNTIGITACYAMICIVYIGAYYKAMFRRDIVINGQAPLQILR